MNRQEGGTAARKLPGLVTSHQTRLRPAPPLTHQAGVLPGAWLVSHTHLAPLLHGLGVAVVKHKPVAALDGAGKLHHNTLSGHLQLPYRL